MFTQMSWYRNSVRQTCRHNHCHRHRSKVLGYRGLCYDTGTRSHRTLLHSHNENIFTFQML